MPNCRKLSTQSMLQPDVSVCRKEGRENVCTGAALTVPYSWRLKSINSSMAESLQRVQDNDFNQLWENFSINKCQLKGRLYCQHQ